MPGVAEQKRRSRLTLHARAGVTCFYQHSNLPDDIPAKGLELTARWHNKIDRQGDLDNDYGTVLEGIDRIILSDSQVAAINEDREEAELDPVYINSGGILTFPDYKNAEFALDTKEPADGPIETIWIVARQRA